MNDRLKRAYRDLCNGDYRAALAGFVLLGRFGDAFVTARTHRKKYGAYPSLWRPKRFRDRLLRLMLSSDGRSEIRARITDKEAVKDYIRQRVGDGFTARTYAVLRSKEEVGRFEFPVDCAVKATHTSRGVVLRRDGSPVDRPKIARWFDHDYYWLLREPNYRNLTPKVIVEELLTLPGSSDLPDFKVFCFEGIPAFVQVDVDRYTNHRRGFYSLRWNELDFLLNYERPDRKIPRPAGLNSMLAVASQLSSGFSFLRVDCFQLENRIVVGELTNFPEGTHTRFVPDAADFKAGTLFETPDQDCESLFGVLGGESAIRMES